MENRTLEITSATGTKYQFVEFYFTKKNGGIRRAFGTTMKSLAKAHTVGGQPSSPKVITFFDVEKSEWRSCQIHSLLKVC